MDNKDFMNNVREKIGDIAWFIFLLSRKLTAEQYWTSVARQEKQYTETGDIPG